MSLICVKIGMSFFPLETGLKMNDLSTVFSNHLLRGAALTRIHAQQECSEVYLLRETVSQSIHIICMD